MTKGSHGPGEQVFGREGEFAAIQRLLGATRERCSVLLFDGEAGIGKTTVFRTALAMAEADGFHVLTCRPSALEVPLSLAAVGDLLEDVPAQYWDALPAPQRRALDIALLRVDPDESAIDHRAIGAGFRSLVTALATERPVLLAVDDLQWLDPASAAILAFVVRRLGSEKVGVLATHRLPEPAPLDLAAVAPAGDIVRHPLGPLGPGALQLAVTARLGSVLPSSVMARVHAASQGNPLFALEIGRLLVERGTIPAGEPLPVPDDVRELVQARVAELPAATRDLLLAAAELAQPTIETLGRALARPLEPDLRPAEHAGMAVLDEGRVVFVHPLHAAAVIATATETERRQMHRRLAGAVAHRGERARHLALGADGPDETIATLLQECADDARTRGRLHSAADLLEWAARLTPASDIVTAHGRGIRAAELRLHAGDSGRARTLLQDLLAEALVPAQRADALRILGELCFGEEDLPQGEQLLVEALASAEDARTTARIQLDLMFVTTNLRMDFAGAADLGQRALANLEGSTERPLIAEALAHSAMTDFLSGGGIDWAKVDKALELEDADRIPPIGLPPSALAACLLSFAGRHVEARQMFGSVRDRLSQLGQEGDLAQVLLWLSWHETRCGDFAAAARAAVESLTYADLSGNLSMRRLACAQRAWVHAHCGEIAEAQERLADAQPPDQRGTALALLWIVASAALAGLSVDDPQAAWEACRPLTEAIEQFGIAEPVPLFFLPDALEALIALGELDRAEALLDTFEERGRELDRVWAMATGARCRGLLLGARGDLSGAMAALERALKDHERIELPFDRARTLLGKGTTERRLRRRTAAKRTLGEAAAEFDRLGAVLWAARARNEMDRVGGSRARTEGGLTASERRAVELAAGGLSNKEIAARLTVSVHTVEVHLSHAYEKLGVRSRSQLAGRLSGES